MRYDYPMLVSFVPDLQLCFYPLDESIKRLLTDSNVSSVSTISYSISYEALERLGILQNREQTRIIVRPPDGILRNDLEKLLSQERTIKTLEVRQVDLNLIQETVHHKLLMFSWTNGRQFVIVGSANFTSAGTSSFIKERNRELSCLIELDSKNKLHFNEMFGELWDKSIKPKINQYFIRHFSNKFIQKKYPPQLLPFQDDCFNGLTKIYKEKKFKGALLSLPTGTGKTIIATRFLFESVLVNRKTRVLWIAPHMELLYQALSTFNLCSPYKRFIELEWTDERDLATGERFEDTHIHLSTMRKEFNETDLEIEYDVVVVDEAHYGASFECSMLPTIREYYPKAFFLGLTATPFRKKISELNHLIQIFGPLKAIDKNEIENVYDGFGRAVMPRVRPIVIETGYNIAIDDTSLEAVELKEQSLQKFNTTIRNNKIASEWIESYGKTLVFAVNIAHANDLARAFKKVHPQITLQVLHGGKISQDISLHINPQRETFTKSERLKIQHSFRRGDIHCLIAVELYTMGIDFPQVKTLFMARPTLSSVRYSQMLGRGLRGPAFGGTEELNVIDFADQIDTHEHLSKRLMSYHKEEKWLEDFEEQILNLRRIEKSIITGRPKSTRNNMYGEGAVYRVQISSRKETRSRFDWKWVRNLGEALNNALENESIEPKDYVDYIFEDSSVKGNETKSFLKLVENLGFYVDVG